MKTPDKHLWAAKVHSANGEAQLWITTDDQWIQNAFKKAKAFLRGNKEYPNATIESIEWQGTIDA